MFGTAQQKGLNKTAVRSCNKILYTQNQHTTATCKSINLKNNVEKMKT